MATCNKVAEEERIGWRSLDPSVYVKITLIALLLWWFFRLEIDNVVYRWATDPSWSHGFLIPLFSLYFLSRHTRDIVTLKPKVSYLGLVLLIGCFIFYTLNVVYFHIGYFQPLTLIAAIGATVLFLGGWELVQYTWLPIIYLVFAVKLPDRVYTGLTIPMRMFAARIASALLSMVRGLEATAGGVVIDVIYNGKQMDPPLDVAEACSGMRLLMAFLALGVAMAYLHYRPVWQRLVLLASTIPIAILCNVVRVTVTGFIYVLGDPKYAQGLYHDLLGMGMLPLAFGLYGGLAWFMSNLFVDEAQMQKNVIVRRRN
mgnify:CR=1 FL=1